jgi:hypothetical protein
VEDSSAGADGENCCRDQGSSYAAPPPRHRAIKERFAHGEEVGLGTAPD